MTDYCEKCNLLLINDRERKVGLCRFCIEKLSKIGTVKDEKLILNEKGKELLKVKK